MRAASPIALAALQTLLGCQRDAEPAQEPARQEASVTAATPETLDGASNADATPIGRCIVPLAPSPSAPPKKAAQCPRDPERSPPKLPKAEVSFPEAPRQPTLEVEVARSAEEHERGLMYRTSLGPMQGMIFTWDDERLREFWMKNTCIPLDMLYLAKDGTIVGVLEDVPVLNEAPRAVRCEAASVVEVNAGWARKHGVTPGMKASLSL